MKKTRKNKKGMTPIVATILLLMMVVAAAGASFYWLIKIQSQMQGSTEQYQEKVFERLSSTLNWEDADYNSSSGVLSMYIQNVGTTEIPVDNSSSDPTTTWILKDSEQTTVCSAKWNGNPNPMCNSGCGSNIQQSSVRKIELDISGANCNISSYSEDTLMRATIFFSGKASVSGTFEK